MSENYNISSFEKEDWPHETFPLITTYLNKGDLYSYLGNYLNTIERVKISLSPEQDFEVFFDHLRQMGIRRNVVFIDLQDDILYISPFLNGFVVVSEYSCFKDNLCSDSNCVLELLRNRTIEQISFFDKVEAEKEKIIYNSRFYFDYYIGDRKVSKKEYLEYQNLLIEESKKQCKGYLIEDLFNITKEYLQGVKVR